MVRRLVSPLVVFALCTLLAAGAELFFFHRLTPLENRLSDSFVRRHARDRKPDSSIIVVDIDERSLAKMEKFAGRWPWPRAVHGELVAGIEKQHPKAIVFDILFSEPDIYRRQSDAYFNQVLGATRNTFLPILRQNPADDARGVLLRSLAPAFGLPADSGAPDARAMLLLPWVVNAKNWRLGAINFLADNDGVGRRYAIYLPVHGWRIPSLPARVAAFLGYPLPKQPSIILNWRGPAFSYPHVSYGDIIEDFNRRHPRRNPHEFTGKIVIIGATASGLHDLRATPVSSLYPAVEILATAIDNLKHGDFLRTAPPVIPFLIALMLVGGLLAAFERRRHPVAIGAALLAATAALLAASNLALDRRLLLPILTPVIFAWTFYFAAALHAYLRERQAREHTIRTFNRFLDPRVVKTLVGRGEDMRTLSGKNCELTVLFSDIRGFTALSEQHTAQAIVALLNRYFSRQVTVIFRHGGTLDKFIGDAVMAFWGAPADDGRQAEHAVACALDMADTLAAFRRELGAAGAAFDIGIGIHTGPAVVGFIGSAQRQDYTAIGDTVNLASRIEGQTKGVGRILVSAATRQRCGEAFDFIDHGFYKVKGRSQEVQLFEPSRKS
ncbi:MAG TPA: adenylate/guanylate cyclase domain-containing protein [Betaproteobacteria bacterium]|nr:adenylate/guanylate cyclase domain-containing protein [Betaproteobacteria bacterium]